MPTTTSQLFDFLEEHQPFVLERHEIASAAFTDLRYSVRSIIVSLAESDDFDATEMSQRLRSILSQWLTVPTPFDEAIVTAITELGEAEEVEGRWGRDTGSHYTDACMNAQELSSVESPVRAKLAELISNLHGTGSSYRIFCDRRIAKDHFESLGSEYGCPALDAATFIHSVAQYRELEPFDCLIKMGPLRSRGWGSVPDAVITAPRFGKLIQVAWSGCGNESDFGYDPTSAVSNCDGTQGGESGVPDGSSSAIKLRWEVQETQSRDNTIGRMGSIPDVDEFEVFAQLATPYETQAATLVQVDEGHGVLYPPHSRALGFDPDAGDIQYRLPGETLVAGMFLIIPVVDDTRLGGLQAEDGRFSPIWKEALSSEYSRDPSGLTTRLRNADLKLVHLRSCIERWCMPATTVIHAPQMIRHFEILIKTLGIDFDHGDHRLSPKAAWWQYAWDEIRRSRGEAIHSGFQEQQNVDEELLIELQTLRSEMLSRLDCPAFALPIPEDATVAGVFKFYRILSVEEGLQAPRSEMRVLFDLEGLDQWRI